MVEGSNASAALLKCLSPLLDVNSIAVELIISYLWSILSGFASTGSVPPPSTASATLKIFLLHFFLFENISIPLSLAHGVVFVCYDGYIWTAEQ